MQPSTFVFMGKSGSGKGTQAKLLKEYLQQHDDRKVLYFVTGHKLRELCEKGTYTSGKVERLMEEGDLAPVFLPVWAWSDFLVHEYTGEEHIIFDGLARREIEAPVLDSAMAFYGIEHLNVVHLKVSDEWARERLLARGREDDNEEEIAKRLSWFGENTAKALEYFEKNESRSFHEINGEQSIEEVHDEILNKLALG